MFFAPLQILFVSGLSFVIGLERTFRFFFQRHKAKATSFFLGGVLVVLIGWPIIGVILEIYGFFLLFRSAEVKMPLCHHYQCLYLIPVSLSVCRGFFPVAVGFIRRVPVLGSLLSLPGISAVRQSMRPTQTLNLLGIFKLPQILINHLFRYYYCVLMRLRDFSFISSLIQPN